ncbi:TetR/AcrR family transcriptional regulator [Microbispora amethystogenes]|uniref:TetR family transcriptional regulator n=1 Tax=Microbispora amethystogenes TaxID=1427754 RepID=A0ABQ4F9D8_9ACTN|nr:TetR/AcrR family transcriptional regulator [Microbispora amethystogenes]GIH31436.1 TetR family transcriptional regulator [Microbispora amethystogenes]
MARRQAPGTRERILRVASRLFQENGVRAVGMQQVVEEVGLGKSLLYREFDGKDDLVAAWLRESDAAWWAAVDAALAPHDGDPAGQLLALVELVAAAAASPGFHGCVFYNTSSEFRDDDHPARQEALAHLRRMRGRLETLAGAAGAAHPGALADELMLVVGGMYATGAALGPDGPVRAGVAAAGSAIARHCATGH